MMSSSPPHQQNTGFSQHSNQQSKNQNQSLNEPHLLSSPTFQNELNLQLESLDTSLPHKLDNSHNYTTNEHHVNHENGSDNSIVYETLKNQQTQHENLLKQRNSNESYHQQQDDPQNHYQNSQYHTQQPQQYNHQQYGHEVYEEPQLQGQYQYQYHRSDQYSQQQAPYFEQYPSSSVSRHSTRNSDYGDYVPTSRNADPSLQFPTSSSYNNIPASSSFNTNSQLNLSGSSNSLSSNLLATPHQPARRLSFTANLMSSVNTNSNNRSPTSISATPVRTSLATPKIQYTHRRSKSKLTVEKSPGGSSNPFYNPPNFISPKVTKKSHRKNISISNPIALTHLDTDLNYHQSSYQIGKSGSPNDTPLRTPGRIHDSMSYGNIVSYSKDYDDANDELHDNFEGGEEDDEEIMNGGNNYKYIKEDNTSANNTFIVPNVLMNNRFGGELIDTTVTDELPVTINEPQSSILDTGSVTDMNMNFLDDMFVDTTTVESLNDQPFFQFPTLTLEKPNAYFDTLDQLDQKHKFLPYDTEIRQPDLEEDPDIQSLSYIDNVNYNKSASVPQTRLNSVSVDSKFPRSRSSYNLSSIASTRDIKNHEQFGFQKDNLTPHLEVSDAPYIGNHKRMPSSSASSSLQSIAERGASVPTTAGSKELMGITESFNEPTSNSVPSSKSNATTILGSSIKTRSKSRSLSNASNIQHPEKLDLPQQSARSKSRTKKSANEDKKVHECPLCHMRFQRPEHVKRHMLSHSSEKPFACTEPDCDKRFNRNDNLKQHLRNIHKRKI